MKKITLFIGMVVIMATASKADGIVYIPDANFKTALLAYAGLDANSDGEIQCSEALTLTFKICPCILIAQRVNNNKI